MPRTPLIPLLMELLKDHGLQKEKDDEARRKALGEALEELHAKYREEAQKSGIEITEECEQELHARAMADVKLPVTRVSRDRPETPWEVGLSHLFSAIQVPLTDERDPQVRLRRKYHLPVDLTFDESALREYLVTLRLNGVRETSLLSAELARLDGEGFGTRLAEILRQQFPMETKAILAPVRFQSAKGPADSMSVPSAVSTVRKLSDTERRILTHCRRKAHKSERIAVHVGLSWGHVRRVLARLMREHRLRNTADGYRTIRAT
jgi:hypothetical protein